MDSIHSNGNAVKSSIPKTPELTTNGTNNDTTSSASSQADINSASTRAALPVFTVAKTAMIPQLPAGVAPDHDLARKAAPWLDAYIGYSKRWAPDAYDGYHEAAGLWVLSTVAARRAAFPLGGIRFTSLYIALVSRTSVFSKTTAAKVGTTVLCAAGLNHLLCPDEMTPQAFIDHLAMTALPSNYNDLDGRGRDWYKGAVAFAGQKGWYYDEFGSKITAMMRDGGHMAEYRGILRVMDDGRDEYSYVSIGRGVNKVKHPYLALMGNMTPADLRPYARKGASLWSDGFWARWAFVSPSEDDQPKQGRWPNELQTVPASLSQPLADWHRRLGVPRVEILDQGDDNGSKKGGIPVNVESIEPTIVGMPSETYDAYYAYRHALVGIITAGQNEDLDGNYSRLPEKAIRIAAMLASFHGEKEIRIQYWHRALEIAERWRVDLHSLYRQLSGAVEVTRARSLEDAIVEQLKRRGPLTARELKQFTNQGSDEVKTALSGMVGDGTLLEVNEGKATRYVLI